MAEPLLAPAPVTAGGTRLLLILSGNMVLDAIEVSLVLVALPAIADDLGLSIGTAQWLLTGFAAGFAAGLLLGPALTARWGLRRGYLAALLVFAAASVAGGLSDTLWVLVAARIVKGGCAALTAPAGLSLIAAGFPDGPPLRRAVSVYSLFGAAGFTLGLLLSGALTPLSWHWTFLFPAPAALALLAGAVRVLPRTGHPAPPRLTARPLRHAPLVRSALSAATLNGGYAAVLLVVTFQTTDRFGWQPWQLALALLPACVPLAVLLPFAGRLTARFGTSGPIAAGAACALAGQLLLLLRPEPRSYTLGVLPALLLVGAALVLSFAPLNLQATRDIPAAARGAAVPVYQTGVQLGGVLLLPVVGLLAARGPGYRPALLAIACAGAVGALLSLTGLRGRSPKGAIPS